ncbi:MAG TPA: hypothetical protein VJ279_00350, partial [Hanamia sp.]|nr:hypothetical protein [Hanamia sp.]
MKIFKRFPYLFFTFFITFLVAGNLFAQVQFIENKGQWDSRVKFMSNAGDGSFFLEEKGFTISQYNPSDIENIKEKRHREATQQKTGNLK